ncbi:MAG: hypothetical protein E7321_00080 [Clostridiales bacterium]|nr:hypothetical protein [Clostridiales bacterium]
MAANERVLTEEEKEEIVLTYIESMIFPEKYGGHRVRQKDLAEKYGVNQSTISKIVTSSDEVSRLNKRMQTRTIVAQSMAQLAAPKVMEATIKDALKERDDAFGYLSQNARRDVLDRAGVRAVSDNKQEVTVSFASGMNVRPRMPEREESGEE